MAAVDVESIQRALHAGDLPHAATLLREAVRRHPSSAELHAQLGMVLAQLGTADVAVNALRTALRLKPDLADAAFELGNLLATGGRLPEAIAAYRRAVTAQPRFAAAHNNLGMALEAEGRWEEALEAYKAAVAVDAHPQVCANVARCLASMPRVRCDDDTRALVARAMDEAWVRPADLARLAVGMLRAHPAIAPAITRAVEAWPERLPAPQLLAATTLDAWCHEPLAVALLENAPAADRDFERFLTAARHALLECTRKPQLAALLERAVPFACALARQCFLGDYVFCSTPEEDAEVQRLETALADALRRGETPPASALAVLACYRPLGSLPDAARLLESAWPPRLRAVLAQQVEEAHAEQRLRETLPMLTPIRDDISQRVRAQYEESPYPRWTRLPPSPALPLDAYLRSLFPHASLPPRGSIAERDILVAGCGTGQEAVDRARQFPASRILAIDLSRASLAFAARKTREAGCANVEYAQADLLELPAAGRAFDMISCCGVLHHLADPLAGWRALAAVLRPGGFMQVGLYSEIARRGIAAVREMIAQRRYEATPAGIRRAREAIAANPDWRAVWSLRDFYGLNECRDLLFHVQEHCFTLPRVRASVEAAGLRFVGLAVAPALAHAFARRFPGAPHDDLDRWHAFETEHPQAFAGMYLFWVQKPASA